MIAEGESVGMRERDRRLRDVQNASHRLMRRVREINHNSKPVELADDRAAECVEAAVPRGVCCGVDPVEALVVAERHQPDAGRMPDAQWAQRILETNAAFDRDERGDSAERLGPWIVGRLSSGEKY